MGHRGTAAVTGQRSQARHASTKHKSIGNYPMPGQAGREQGCTKDLANALKHPRHPQYKNLSA
eukprot:CAMPEP_0204440738 /NCGR_PEP_ID=MMETSP0470-20130426/83893_1 /ASSEMBLY_ACC=CAM_ASM_000385 /TAXON_ID=2969 /ORGANISM="Oxyrrhis marina" /LENGTH=62 /DNA_ID=CAMNT_0051439789 /DNA_START=98 /DNA_END=283 /DNA_ORIENTATION=+